MPSARLGEINLEYEEFGDPADPTVLLIMGLGAQMTVWPTEFCAAIAEAGRHVVRFDNRDVGLSSKTEGPAPDMVAIVTAALAGGEVPPVPYTLSDMAADAVGLLDVLGVDRAHVVGASMGGMIAQTVAIEHGQRVATLTSIMSTTGDPSVGQPVGDVLMRLLAPPPAGRDAVIAAGVEVARAIAGPHFDEDEARRRSIETYERCFHPIGTAFQVAAIAASGDRTARLADVDAPTLVIHGRVDPLVTLSGGEATAAAVPGARLLVLDEMGHDLPRPLWPELVGAIVEHTG